MSRNERDKKGSQGQDPLLLPALDKPTGGVQWGSVAKLVNLVKEGSSISKHLRHALRTRLTCGEERRVLNTLTVLHTISLNGSLEVRKQLADTKLLKLLEKVYTSFSDNGLVIAAVSQTLVDWAFLFGDEDVGQKAARLMKHLRSMGAPALGHSQVAAERWEERELGIPIMHFVHGVDFGAPSSPTSQEDNSGGFQKQEGETAQNKQPRMGKWRKLFTKRAPGTPGKLRSSASQPSHKTNGRTPSWVEDLFARMPVDAGDLKKVVDSICSLKENGALESDTEGMIAATLPLAEKVETWGSQALELLTSQMDNIATAAESVDAQGPARQAGIVLDDDKLSTLLKLSDEVQETVAAWKQLQQDADYKLSSEFLSPDADRKESRHKKAMSQSSSITSPCGLYPDRESPERILDYGDEPISSTPSWMGPMELPVGDYRPTSACSGALGFGPVSVGEDSYSPGRIAPVKHKIPSSLSSPRHRPVAGRKSQRHAGQSKLSKGGGEVGIIQSFDSEVFNANADGINPGFISADAYLATPHTWDRPLVDLSHLWTGMGGPDGEDKQSEDLGLTSKNPFVRDAQPEVLGSTQSLPHWISTDGAVPSNKGTARQAQSARIVGPSQDPSNDATHTIGRRSPIATDTSQMAESRSCSTTLPASSLPAFSDSSLRKESARSPGRPCDEMESRVNPFRNKVHLSVCDRYDLNRHSELDDFAGSNRASTPPPGVGGLESGFVPRKTNPFEKHEPGAHCHQSRNPFVSHADDAKAREEATREDLQTLPKAPNDSSCKPLGALTLTRKTNSHTRRSRRKERKGWSSVNHHVGPFHDLKNKTASPAGGGAPPRIQALKRGSLDMSKGGPLRAIPALRVRFTPEHLKEVVERIGDSKEKDFPCGEQSFVD